MLVFRGVHVAAEFVRRKPELRFEAEVSRVLTWRSLEGLMAE